jgi:phytanoyl-CoA hydroxylase
MEIISVKQELDMQSTNEYYAKQQIQENGYFIYRNFFPNEYIENIKKSAESVFSIQFDRFNYTGTFQEKMIRLFDEQQQTFINCGKIIQQGLIELYKLPLENKLLNELKMLGIDFPVMCTRPVMFFNHPKLAKEVVYYKTPPHQDWPSMEASQDSLVVWVPLIDTNKENGSIIIYPGSHKNGVLPFTSNNGFAEVNFIGESTQPIVNTGDIVIFSTLLVHESGDILNDSIRWSCHFRFTNMLDPDYINRGFPNPYIYKPTTKS